jgi:DNA-binding transcriptional regulator GbsR (MarR family)
MDTYGQRAELVSFADEFGRFYAGFGFPHAWGRVVGWLLVCQPSCQSTEDLATVLYASRASINATTRTLVHAGMLERQTRRGDRRTYYRIRPEVWTSVFEEQTRTATKLRKLAQRGLELLNGQPDERRHRLRELHDLAVLYEQEGPALLARWQKHRQHTAGEARYGRPASCS